MLGDNLDLDQISLQEEKDEVDEDLSSFPILRLRRLLTIISKAFEDGNFQKADCAILDLVTFLDGFVESALSLDSEAVLSEIHRFVLSPSSNQMAVDALAIEVPRVVVRFGSVSHKSRELAESIISCFISVSNPRDMLPAFCNALHSLLEVSTAPIHFVILLNGLSKVFYCIKLHLIKEVKHALPSILRAMQYKLLHIDNTCEDSLGESVNAAIAIATSIQFISDRLVGGMKQELNSILGLYVLQTMALVSKSNLANEASACDSYIKDLLHFLPLCKMSYSGLMTGSDVDAIIDLSKTEGTTDLMSCFDLVKDGASLAVIWRCISSTIAEVAEEKLDVVLGRLRIDKDNRWKAVNMLRRVLSSTAYPWVFKEHAIDLVLNMMDGQIPDEQNNDNVDYLDIFLSMQAIQRVVIYAPEASLRKKSFTALKKVLSDIPSLLQFDVLKDLINNSTCSSMIALLIDLVKEKVFPRHRHEVSCMLNDETERSNKTKHIVQPIWCLNALELVGSILKPCDGGPPSLPEHNEAVLSALNLYRFILLTESKGNTNYSGVLSRGSLQKAYVEWLLPLRILVSKIDAENKGNSCEESDFICCSLNPLQLVLYRCIELVEDFQKQQ